MKLAMKIQNSFDINAYSKQLNFKNYVENEDNLEEEIE
jgi:hypothetical protein